MKHRIMLPTTSSFALDLLRMSGSYPLTNRSIDQQIVRVSPGNYALGYMEDDTFSVFYVGRSDSDLRADLHAWVGAPSAFDRHAFTGKAPWALRMGKTLPLGAPRFAPVSHCSDTSYTHFAFSYAGSSQAAFEKECRNYEDFGCYNGLDNRTAPVPPFSQLARSAR